MASHGHDAHGEHHVLPLSLYWGVFGILLVLTVITYLVSFAGLPGALSIGVAMAVAATKATLVCAYFMHLKYDDRINTLILVVSVLTMGLFFAFTMIDEKSRGFIVPEEATLGWQNENSMLKAIAASKEPAAPAHGAPAAAADGSGHAPAAGSGEAPKAGSGH
jgi:cytochrome c oxidase subunit 4